MLSLFFNAQFITVMMTWLAHGYSMMTRHCGYGTSDNAESESSSSVDDDLLKLGLYPASTDRPNEDIIKMRIIINCVNRRPPNRFLGTNLL